MFARFRESHKRLQVSVVETRRISPARVRHEHVASLGSTELPLTVAGRIEFWRRLHERLARLSNRIDGTVQGKVLGAIHARIPMVTPDEQHALQIENAESDVRFWGNLHSAHQENVEQHKGLATTVERSIAENQKAAVEAGAKRAAVQDRLERLKKGENLPGGLGKPLTREDMEQILRKNGYTTADIRHSDLMAAFTDQVGEAGFEEYLQEFSKLSEETRHARSRAAMRTILRKRGYAL
jgi:hypothetical protein